LNLFLDLHIFRSLSNLFYSALVLQLLSSEERLRVPDNARANASIEAMERQMWNAVPTTGVLQLSFDPATGARRSIFMNQVENITKSDLSDCSIFGKSIGR
jgi:hypothetical protein